MPTNAQICSLYELCRCLNLYSFTSSVAITSSGNPIGDKDMLRWIQDDMNRYSPVRIKLNIGTTGSNNPYLRMTCDDKVQNFVFPIHSLSTFFLLTKQFIHECINVY